MEKDINAIFEKANGELSPKYRGKIVAIDADTSAYFIGNNELDAYKKAIKKFPNKQFIFKRIGFDSTHFASYPHVTTIIFTSLPR